eukprot:6436195-Amphidinium_carterae.2
MRSSSISSANSCTPSSGRRFRAIRPGLSGSLTGMDEIFDTSQLDHHLARALLSYQQTLGKVQYLSICMDKSAVGGLPLQAGLAGSST